MRYTIRRFNDYAQKNPDSKNMGTTLTFLYIHKRSITIGHIVDSRIYHIRKDHILHQPLDHSLVNEMINRNIITKEEAISHPHRNIITRSIQSNKSSDDMDIELIRDIQDEDYICLCTDGILEAIETNSNSNTLIDILSKEESNDAKMHTIIELCNMRSRDNFSAYLVQLGNDSNKNLQS